MQKIFCVFLLSHPARGAWIEITIFQSISVNVVSSRTPQGVRGLKSNTEPRPTRQSPKSHPARGAWIEIFQRSRHCAPFESHPARGAWIEIAKRRTRRHTCRRSHPARGAWIEISHLITSFLRLLSHPARGAWIEILLSCAVRDAFPLSHPARGAWIEIHRYREQGRIHFVAPRKGCVD